MTPLHAKSAPTRKKPTRSSTADSDRSSIFRKRRRLHRVAGLLTTKGQPVPAIAETIVETPASAPPQLPSQRPPPTAMLGTSHRRDHANSVLSYHLAEPGEQQQRSLGPARRRSDGSASLGLGGSIRRKLKEVKDVGGAYLSRSLSSRSSNERSTKDEFGASSSDLKVGMRRSISARLSASSSTPRVAQSTPSSGGAIKRHGRSYSDILRKRPFVTHSASEPDVVYHPTNSVFETSMSDLTANASREDTSLPVVSSPKAFTTDPPNLHPAESTGSSSNEELKSRPLSTIHEPEHAAEDAQSLVSPLSPTAVTSTDFIIPQLLLNGVPMLKVSAKKQKQYFFSVDANEGQIIWRSKKLRIIPIETIKEIRTGADARYYREQFQLASEYEDRWLTLVYVLDGSYKTLHLLAATRDVFQMWDTTIRRLYEIRKQLMSGLGHGAVRQAVWEKQFWKGADEENDQKLDFDDVEKMCRRLNINPSRDDLMRRFQAADSQNRGYLDFSDFRKFVKALKTRPELDRLFKKLVAKSGSTDSYLRYPAFEAFMRKHQNSSLDATALQKLFVKYASLPEDTHAHTPSSPARNPLELAMHAATSSMRPPATSASAESSSTSTSGSSPNASPSSPPAPASSESNPAAVVPLTYETGVWTSRQFTSFLLSSDNSAFRDDKHDMTRPLPEYYISSSHNTYLVGHQLVGESTIEGYIRALLHSCRSVELDIYDGETEPVIYHGKTLTTRIPLRDICQAIHRYAFVTSPYPIIISAEVHCGLVQQGLIAAIMSEVFGDALVKAPVDARPRIEALPSPEDLKGMVLLKAKNLYVTETEGIQENEVSVDTESSSTTSTETSASDTDIKDEVKREFKQELQKAREEEAEMIKGLKSELSKAKKVFGRVHRRRSSSDQSRPALALGPSSSSSAAATVTTITTAAPAAALSPALTPSGRPEKTKVRMSFELVALLVYTVGVKCRGLNKKEVYAPEHVFSLSESTANKILKQGMMDLIKHNRTHLVRTYPKGTRIGSTNYEPHRYWSAGCQLVAINWQTFDLGYMINHAMFQRNDRLGYVLKPTPLRNADKHLLSQRTQHFLDVTIISAQQLPRAKDALGREIVDKSILDPYVEVSLHIPDWTHSPFLPPTGASSPRRAYSPPNTNTSTTTGSATSARTVTVKTFVVKNNGFNPVWEQALSVPFDCVGNMMDLVFVRFAVRQEDKDDEEPLAVYCTSLASLNLGYRHLPLHDAQLSQYLFSTLFIHTSIRDVPAQTPAQAKA